MGSLTFWMAFQFMFIVIGLGYLMNVAHRQLDALEEIRDLLKKHLGS